MGTLIKSDLVQGSSVTRTGSDINIVRKYFVGDLTEDPDARLLEATDPILTPGIPDVGAEHPSISGVFCTDVSGEPAEGSTNQAFVTAKYSVKTTSVLPDDDGPCDVSVGSTIQTLESSYDVDGNLLVVTYEDENGVVYSQTGTVQRSVVLLTVTFSRLEATDPITRALTYTNKVNSGSFLGFGAGEWLISRVNQRKQGVAWLVDYELTLSPTDEGWIDRIVYKTPDGEIPNGDNIAPAVSEGNGQKTLPAYQSEDFGPLNLGY